MDTQAKIAEQVLRLLSAGDDNGRWDRREIILSICQQRDYLAKMAYFEAQKTDSDLSDLWISPFDPITTTKNPPPGYL